MDNATDDIDLSNYWLDYTAQHAETGVLHLMTLQNVNFDDMMAAHERLVNCFNRYKDGGKLTKKDGQDFNLVCSMAAIFGSIPRNAGFGFQVSFAKWNESFCEQLLAQDIAGTIKRHRYVQNFYSPVFAETLVADSQEAVSYEAFRLFLDYTGAAPGTINTEENDHAVNN